MGAKLGTALLAGIFFTFFLDFFFFLGVFLNYIRALEIDVYYNILFADNQNLWLYSIGILLFGFLFVFLNNTKVATIIFMVCFALVNVTMIPSFGLQAGEMMFKRENKILKEGGHTYIGSIMYEGRDKIWFYDDEINEMVILTKER